MAATFYADSAGTQGTGTGVSAANASTLKQFIEDDVILHTARAAGDVCYCKNGTTITYDGSAGAFANTAVAGTTAAPVRVIGYATTITDQGVVVIQDSDAGATSACLVIDVDYWQIENIKLMDTRDGINTGTTNGHFFRNIEIDNPAGEGFDIGGGTGEVVYLDNCYVHDGSQDGFSMVHRACRISNCVSINNSVGFDLGHAAYGVIAVNCLAHANTGDGFDVAGEVVLINCVSNQNGSDGYYIADADTATFINCGATSNAAYGVQGVASTVVRADYCSLNPTNETNTSGKVNATNVTLNESNEITGDPDFTDSAPVTKTDVDLSLSSTSAWKATGTGIGGAGFTATATSVDVGPAQRAEPAAGGGLLIHPGMTGGMRG